MVWRSAKNRGFTPIEPLVVIAIIALLIAILLPSLGQAKKLAAQTREMAAGQQKIESFENYALDNKESQFPGYAPWSVGHLSNQAGGYVLLHPDANQPGYYVEGNVIKPNGYRFMGATEMSIEALQVDRKTAADFRTRTQACTFNNGWQPRTTLYDGQAGGMAAAIAYHPSLGQNMAMVGGSANHGGYPGAVSGRPWKAASHTTTKQGQVRFTSKLIVFASARGVDIGSVAGGYPSYGSYGTRPAAGTANIVPGYHEVVPPVALPSNMLGGGAPDWAGGWTNASNTFKANTDPASWGMTDMRHFDKAVTVMTDGHVEMLGLKQLRDMRYWSNQANRATYNFTPASNQ